MLILKLIEFRLKMNYDVCLITTNTIHCDGCYVMTSSEYVYMSLHYSITWVYIIWCHLFCNARVNMPTENGLDPTRIVYKVYHLINAFWNCSQALICLIFKLIQLSPKIIIYHSLRAISECRRFSSGPRGPTERLITGHAAYWFKFNHFCNPPYQIPLVLI